MRIVVLTFVSVLMLSLGLYSQSELYRHKHYTIQGKLTSAFRTGLVVEENEFVYFQVSSKIELGKYAGSTYGDGLDATNVVFSSYNKYKNQYHGALVLGIGDFNNIISARKMFRAPVNGFDEAIYRVFLVNPSDLIPDALGGYVAGNYFISSKKGEIILDINDIKTEDNSGDFFVEIYTITFNNHCTRNKYNICPKKEPGGIVPCYVGCKDCKGYTWRQELPNSIYYHGYNDSFRGTNQHAGCQCVYDQDTLLKNDYHEGSFDIGFWRYGEFSSSESKHLHLILDVLPHDNFVKKYGTKKSLYRGAKEIPCSPNSTLFLFDLSGSMMETGPNASIPKLDQAKNASKQTLKALKSNTSGPEDEVAVLGFSGDCVADPTILISDFETDLQVVENRINTMVAGGGTPLAEAVGAAQCKLANHLAQTGQDKGKLILLSDGQATCQAIRPVGTYNSAPLGQKNISVSADQCGNGKQQIKYYTIGFNIPPGSPAERDLQYLSQISGGKYLNVQSQTQLERAFRKFNRTYLPKPNPSLNGLPAPSLGKFDEGVNQITSESFPAALKTCGEFAALHPDDCHGAYNLALMQEANDFYKQAIANYKKYLSLCPNASDRDFVERQIVFLEEEFKQFVLFQKEVIKSDLEYLKLHFERIQNGQSVTLAEEFKGFLKEKGNYYKDIPEQMGRTDRLFQKNCQEVATGLDNCAATIKRNPQTWDRDATPVLSLTYINLERLLDSF